MTAALIVLGVVCVVLALVSLIIVRSFLRDREETLRIDIAERRELLNRIQRPELIPVGTPLDLDAARLASAREAERRAKLASVGTINYEGKE